MSFSPESFDRLLTDKLAQVPEPAYEPAHWDQLEDQLQHLNHALQAAQPAAHATVVGGTAAVSVAAKVGFAALLAGLTAVNGYFFYAATEAREIASPVTTVAAPLAVAPPAAIERPVTRQPEVAVNAPAISREMPSSVKRVPFVALNQEITPDVVPTLSSAIVTNDLTLPVPAVTVPLAPASHLQPTPVRASSTAPAVSEEVPSARPDSAVTARLADAPTSRPSAGDFFNIITPDGDGLNDQFELPVPAGTCRLTVFDRANRVVFSAEHYDNTWRGGTLPAGQYLYIIETTGSSAWRVPGVLKIQR